MGMLRSLKYRSAFQLLQLVLIMLGVVVLIVALGQIGTGRMALGNLWAALAVLYILLSLRLGNVLSTVIWSCVPKDRLELRVCFDEDGISAGDGVRERRYPYERVKLLLENAGCFYVCMGLGTFFPVEKSGFDGWEPGELKGLLKRRSPGIEIERIEIRK